MDTTVSKEEIKLLDLADNEIAENGKTNIKCPRCGNAIIAENIKNCYVVRCQTDGCISLKYRGI